MERLPFYQPELSRENVGTETDEPVNQELISLLENPEFAQEVERGNATLAMIRPAVGPDANNEGLPDLEAAERIEEMIEGLGFMCKFSFIFTPEATETFYQGGPQKSMSKEEPIDSSKYESRWPEFIDFMASGPTTAIILYSPDGDAVPKWRDHLGHWNIDEVRDMNTIRGKFGVNKYNNLVHGSDAPENIFNELEIIKSCVKTSE